MIVGAQLKEVGMLPWPCYVYNFLSYIPCFIKKSWLRCVDIIENMHTCFFGKLYILQLDVVALRHSKQ